LRTKIDHVVVLGAGLMGSQIAAHLANAGLTVHLLDIVPNKLTEAEEKQGLTLQDKEVRDRFALSSLEKMKKAKPSPIFSKDVLSLITPGNFEDDLHVVKDADWIIEAVIEQLEPKRKLWAEVEKHRRPGTLVSTNTSGLPIAQICEGMSEDFGKHFFGTHFFNPPRYMYLLEMIPGPDTDPAIMEAFKVFAERSLGKGVVYAMDTPNFIANRIGLYALQVTLQAMENMDLTVDEVDAITGRAMGHPKSATFRTLDLVGLDTYLHVLTNIRDAVTDPEEKAIFSVPAYLEAMVEKGFIGEKAGLGFYKKVKGNGKSEIHSLDLKTLEYVPKKKASFASIEMAKQAKTKTEQLAGVVYGKDKAATFAWEVTKKVLIYSANKLGEIAEDIQSIDAAMRWGFNWDFGPFEVWDAIGLEKSINRMEAEGETIPAWVKQLLSDGYKTFYQETEQFTKQVYTSKGMLDIGEPKEIISLARLKKQGKVILSNAGASLIDIGDDVACLELHSPKDAIGEDILNMAIKATEEVNRNYRGMVVTNPGKNFAVGANLMWLLMEIQDWNFDIIEYASKMFQNAGLAFKYSQRPVVVAPAGMALGGGAEFVLHGSHVQAAAETYMGLVEVGVGLIPAGGGTKEMLYRAMANIPEGADVDPQPFVNGVFQTIGLAKVATSAKEAKELGYLQSSDSLTMNREHLLYDAKQQVLHLDKMGYRPPIKKPIKVTGREGRAVLEIGVDHLYRSGYASEHDKLIAGKLANILAGGNVAAGTYVTEEYLLELEREAFLSLCGEPKTQQRIQHILTTGKPLRN